MNVDVALGAEQRHVDHDNIGGRYQDDAGQHHRDQAGDADDFADRDRRAVFGDRSDVAARPDREHHGERQRRERGGDDEQELRRRHRGRAAEIADHVGPDALADGAGHHVVAEHQFQAARAGSADAQHLLARHQHDVAGAHHRGGEQQGFGDAAKAKPAQASAKMAAPSQVVWAS